MIQRIPSSVDEEVEAMALEKGVDVVWDVMNAEDIEASLQRFDRSTVVHGLVELMKQISEERRKSAEREARLWSYEPRIRRPRRDPFEF
jgi:hypothetical protein